MMPQVSPWRTTYLAVLATSFLINTITFPHGNGDLQFCTAQLLPGDPTYEDYYCGWDWEEANAYCEFRCRSGLDEECPDLPNGRKRRCIAASGCFARKEKLYWTGVISLSFDKEKHMSNNAVTTTGDEASATGLPDLSLMTKEEMKAFELSLQEYLSEFLQVDIEVSSVTVREQEYDRPCVSAAVGGGDPDSTSLDMEIRVVGEYIPIEVTFTDDGFGEEVLDAINLYPQSFVSAMKNSSSFFEALQPEGIAAIQEEDVVESPSASPSEPPTRGFEQALDLRIDPRPTGSYGIVFTVRTPKDGNSILLTGMSFVTLHEGKLEYEVYSKLGPFQRFVGRTNMFELVASGQTNGNGAKKYTRILDEDSVGVDAEGKARSYIGFKHLHVPGDRGQRSFYITLTKTFTTDDGSPIPVLFSYPISGTEGEREYVVVGDNDELEVWEGDGVLDYPWPKDKDGPYYRRPRGFIGSFEYDRFPCHPVTNFTGWPCPYVRRTPQPTRNPTKRPTPEPITKRPTNNPTPNPTDNPVTKEVVAETDAPGGTDPEVTTPDPDVTTTDVEAEADGDNENATLIIGIDEKEGTTNNSIAYGGCYGCVITLLVLILI